MTATIITLTRIELMTKNIILKKRIYVYICTELKYTKVTWKETGNEGMHLFLWIYPWCTRYWVEAYLLMPKNIYK